MGRLTMSTYKYQLQFLFKIGFIILFPAFCYAQNIQQDSLLKLYEIDEIILMKEVYSDDKYTYNNPIVYGYDSINVEGKVFYSKRFKKHCVISSENIYTKNGNLIDKSIYNHSIEKTVHGIEYEYNADGTLAKLYKFGSENQHEWTYHYDYDEYGNLSSEIHESMESDFKSKDLYTYAINRIERMESFNNSKSKGSYAYGYDTKNNLVEIYKVVPRPSSLKLEYDEQNRLVKIKYFGSALMDFPTSEIHSFDMNFTKDRVEYTFEYKRNGLLKSKKLYKNGKAIAKVMYNYVQHEK